MVRRPVFVCGDIALVPLTKGYTATIDACDADFVAGFNWTAKVNGSSVYASRWARGCEGKKQIKLHRAIMNAPQGVEVDHIDGDGLNNCRANLRFASRSQNECNKGKSSRNKSGFKGVSWHRASKKWRAAIEKNGIQISLGYYRCAADGAVAYAKASRSIHGEFART